MKLVFVALLFTLLLSACGEDQSGETGSAESNAALFLSPAAGGMHEIYVFCDNNIWNDSIGKYVESQLGGYIYGLPQMEKRFTIFQFEHSDAIKSRMTHRNILNIYVSDKNQHKNLRSERIDNKWAKGQVMYDIQGPNEEQVLKLLQTEVPKIANELEDIERERLMKKYAAKPNQMIDITLQGERNISLQIPARSDLMENYDDFVWIMSNKKGPQNRFQIQEGIFVYEYPYESDSTFTYDFLVAKRDSMLKKYVPGSTDDQYLATQLLEGYEPVIREINFKGKYAMEMRGQYRMENGFMGGPFVSITMVDEKRNRVITVEGYVFAPKFRKRNYIREVEAMIYSLEVMD